MATAFNRSINIQITRPKGFFTHGGNQIEIKELRAEFIVIKHLGRKPNTCEITISNLSEETRAELEVKPLHVRINVGYGDTVGRLFAGDVRWAESERADSDWRTVIHLGDGERAYRYARVNRSHKSGVTVGAAVREIAESMGLKVPRGLKGLDKQYVAGLSLSGEAAVELDRLLTPLGKRWSIQDGRLMILGEDETRRDIAFVMTGPTPGDNGTGVIGSPALGSPARSKEPARLKMRHLLREEIVPGGKIQLFTRDFGGSLFKVTRVVHSGDTHGDRWESAIEAKPL